MRQRELRYTSDQVVRVRDGAPSSRYQRDDGRESRAAAPDRAPLSFAGPTDESWSSNPDEELTRHHVTTKEMSAQQVAAVRRHTSMAKIGDDIAAGLKRVTTAIEAVGACLVGPPFIMFHGSIDDMGGDIEICGPVATPFCGAEEVYGTEIPAGTIASTIHRGSYDKMTLAYAAVMTWMDEHGAEPSGSPREYYLNDLETTKPDDLLTEIAFPIR
jgi:effector-binding domain-containing protein